MDPFTLFYQHFWKQVKSYGPLVELVPPGHMVDLTAPGSESFFNPRVPLSNSYSGPVILFHPSDSDGDSGKDNATSTIRIAYTFAIYTPAYTLGTQLFPTLWRSYEAIQSASRNLRELEYNSEPFVRSVQAGFGEFNNAQLFLSGAGTPELFGWRSTILIDTYFSFELRS